MGLVTLETAKEHLKPPGNIDDTRIERLIEEASDIVLEHIKKQSDAYLTTAGEVDPNLLPKRVRSAVLLVLGVLYDNADGSMDPLSPAVKSLLNGLRVPTLA